MAEGEREVWGNVIEGSVPSKQVVERHINTAYKETKDDFRLYIIAESEEENNEKHRGRKMFP